jgi:hypothetical protein
MLYDFGITVPAGTAENAPIEATLKLTAGLIFYLSVEFPPGCRGYVYAVVKHGGHQLYPTNPQGALNAENFTVQAWDFYPLKEAPYTLKVLGWSPEADYQHTLTVRVNLIRLEDIIKMLPFLEGLQLLMEYMGVPAEVITPPGPQPEPEPTPPAPPVCTLGDKKCEGFDLYECQEVDGEAAWVKVEENSLECNFVPPEPEPPEPEPEPPPPEPEPGPPPEGKILELHYRIKDQDFPIDYVVPKGTFYYLVFKVKNTGPVKAVFKAARYIADPFPGYYYSSPITLVPNQIAYIDWGFGQGAIPGEYPQTWYLYADNVQVDKIDVVHYGGPEEKE